MTDCVVLDGLPLQVRSAGIAVYTRALVRHAAALRPDTTFILYGIGGPGLQVLRWAGTAEPTDDGTAGPAAANIVWHRSPLYPVVMGYPLPGLPRALRLRIDGAAPSLFHATNYAVPRDGRTPVVVTIHDLTLLRFPELGTPALRRLVERTRRAAREARLVIADSQATAADIEQLLAVPASRIRVVYPGCEPRFAPLNRDEARRVVAAQLGVSGPFVLHVGTIEPRKNLERLVTAMVQLRAQRGIPHVLVCASPPGWGAAALHRHIDATGAGDAVRLLGGVPDALLPALYAASDAFAFPSLYEGFGLPLLEAMACGTPAVTANVSALPEIAADAAVYVDPRDPAAIGAGLDRVLHDAGLRAALIARGLARACTFTWERCARETLAVYDEARH